MAQLVKNEHRFTFAEVNRLYGKCEGLLTLTTHVRGVKFDTQGDNAEWRLETENPKHVIPQGFGATERTASGVLADFTPSNGANGCPVLIPKFTARFFGKSDKFTKVTQGDVDILEYAERIAKVKAYYDTEIGMPAPSDLSIARELKAGNEKLCKIANAS